MATGVLCTEATAELLVGAGLVSETRAAFDLAHSMCSNALAVCMVVLVSCLLGGCEFVYCCQPVPPPSAPLPQVEALCTLMLQRMEDDEFVLQVGRSASCCGSHCTAAAAGSSRRNCTSHCIREMHFS